MCVQSIIICSSCCRPVIGCSLYLLLQFTSYTSTYRAIQLTLTLVASTATFNNNLFIDGMWQSVMLIILYLHIYWIHKLLNLQMSCVASGSCGLKAYMSMAEVLTIAHTLLVTRLSWSVIMVLTEIRLTNRNGHWWKNRIRFAILILPWKLVLNLNLKPTKRDFLFFSESRSWAKPTKVAMIFVTRSLNKLQKRWEYAAVETKRKQLDAIASEWEIADVDW